MREEGTHVLCEPGLPPRRLQHRAGTDHDWPAEAVTDAALTGLPDSPAREPQAPTPTSQEP